MPAKKVSTTELRRRLKQSSRDRSQAGWSKSRTYTATGEIKDSQDVRLTIDLKVADALAALSASTVYSPRVVWRMTDGYCRVATGVSPVIMKWTIDGEMKQAVVPASGMTTIRRKTPKLLDSNVVGNFGVLNAPNALYEIGGKVSWQIRSS